MIFHWKEKPPKGSRSWTTGLLSDFVTGTVAFEWHRKSWAVVVNAKYMRATFPRPQAETCEGAMEIAERLIVEMVTKKRDELNELLGRIEEARRDFEVTMRDEPVLVGDGEKGRRS